MYALVYTLLSVAPIILGVLAALVGVVLSHVVSARSEAPVACDPHGDGWALTLNAALDDSAECDVLDLGWEAPTMPRKRAARARRMPRMAARRTYAQRNVRAARRQVGASTTTIPVCAPRARSPPGAMPPHRGPCDWATASSIEFYECLPIIALRQPACFNAIRFSQFIHSSNESRPLAKLH